MKNVAPNLYLSNSGRATVAWDLLESSNVSTTSLSGIGSRAVAGASSANRVTQTAAAVRGRVMGHRVRGSRGSVDYTAFPLAPHRVTAGRTGSFGSRKWGLGGRGRGLVSGDR